MVVRVARRVFLLVTFCAPQPLLSLASTHTPHLHHLQAALFQFSSWLTIATLFICSCTYYYEIRRGGAVPYKIRSPDGAMVVNPATTGMWGVVWKASRIGQRRSAWVGLMCIAMACNALFF